MQEHTAYPVLSSLNKESGFIVPANYFNESASHLELLNTPTLQNIRKKNVFDVPSDYFERNKKQLIVSIEDVNELQAYPTLSSINKVNPFVTSENYFEKNKGTILGKNTNQGGAKIISLFSKPMRFAAAAVLMITIGLWIYNSYFKTVEITEEDCTTLACLEKREIMKYKLENFDAEEILDAAVDLNKLEKNLNKIGQDSLKTADSTDEALLDLME